MIRRWIVVGGVVCIAALLLLLALGMQIGLAFILSGFIASVLILGIDSSVSLLGLSAYFSVATPTWAAIPLFILMGAFASQGGLARRAYEGIHALSRRVPGSLMVATSRLGAAPIHTAEEPMIEATTSGVTATA